MNVLSLAKSAGLAAAWACLAPGAAAQPAANPGAPSPGDPQATVPPLVYQSPFARYRPLGEAAVAPWKAVNDEVGRIGGWKVYAREAHEAAVPAPQGGTASSAPPPGTAAPARPR